jgi:hypothetical protein
MAAIAPTRSAERLSVLAERLPENTAAALVRLIEATDARPDRAAFAARAMEAIADVVEGADRASLTDALGAPSNQAALLQIVARPEFLAALRQRPALAAARARGLLAKERLLNAEGGTCTAEEMARALGISRQSVDNRRKKGALIGLDLGKRGYAYPVWQLGDHGILPGLDRVLAALQDYGPWTAMIFLLGRNIWLDDDRPLDRLRRGEVDAVLAAAEVYGEQTAP